MCRLSLAALTMLVPLASAQDLFPNKVLELTVSASDPVLASHGPSHTFAYGVTQPMRIYVWAASEVVDPFLRVTKPTGELWAEDDNSGGGTTAFLTLDVEAGDRPSITVAAAEAQMSGTVRLHVSERPPESGADSSAQRKLLDESNAARKAGGLDTARAKASELVTFLLAQPAGEQDAAWLELLTAAGRSAFDAQDARTANVAWKRGYEVNSRTLPADHPQLQKAREHLAVTLARVGDLAEARVLQDLVVEVRSRTLHADDFELQKARLNLAAMLSDLGDLANARVLSEQVIEVFSRTLPADHPDLQTTRGNLAMTLRKLGDLAGARALQEPVLEVGSRTLPADHPQLQTARLNLASTLHELGDLAGARLLLEQVLEVYLRTLPADHRNLQIARGNLAVTLHQLGDLAGARALREQVLEVLSRTLPAEHPSLQSARLNLAVTMKARGDLAGARALEEQALEVCSRTLPADHTDLQGARNNLATTLEMLGDLAGARALKEQVLEVRSRTLLADHPNLQKARQNLATTMTALGDLAGARALEEQVLEVRSRTLPADHPDLQDARQNLAITIASERARFPASAGRDREVIRQMEVGRERCAELIGDLCRGQVNAAHIAILGSPAREAEERCASMAVRLDGSLSFAQGYGVFEPLHGLERPVFVFSETTRGAALVSAELTRRAAHSPKYAELRVALGAASDALAGLAQQGTTSTEFDRARVNRESVERELVALARELSGGDESGVEFDVDALAARLGEHDAAVGFRRFTKWRVRVLDELDSTGRPATRTVSTDSLCAFVLRGSRLGSETATNSAAKGDSAPTSSLALIDLGATTPIEEAVREWRAGVGVANDSRGLGASGREDSAPDLYALGALLREKLLDPLLPALAGVQRLVVVLDDMLHLVPLDALPLDEKTLVGDRWRIETRTTLTELLIPGESFEGTGELVAFGDVEYGAGATRSVSHATVSLTATDVTPYTADGEARAGESEPDTADVAQVAADVQPRTGGDEPQGSDVQQQVPRPASILRGGAWAQGFSALPGTGVEVSGIARCFADQYGDVAAMELCERATATRERLLALAPKARYLHIATHGWFAPESVKSWSDPEPLDKRSGLGSRMSGADQVKGMSPMLLCGLALAGANLPEDAVGRAPGLVTADELSTLDLTNCELVVLSACDTNVGERRAGQGVASLQRALQMAGARSVITSLWKVPDEATKELMLDFYRRLWVEKKSKHQALWEAKTKLRHAKDERGNPLYTTRDWAAWVLTGDPR